MTIKEAQHDILQVPITDTMKDWAKEHATISTNRCIAMYTSQSDKFYDEIIEDEFEATILFALRVGILLGRWSENDEMYKL